MNDVARRCFRISGPACLAVFVVFASAPLTLPRAQSSPNATQQAQPLPQSPPAPEQEEVRTRDSDVSLRVRVNLVPVRSVVRDEKGRAITDLHVEDFHLFEDGKPQIISVFSVEKPLALSELAAQPEPRPAAQPTTVAVAEPPAIQPPARFIGLLFDDAHLNIANLIQAREAANHFIDSSVLPSDRVAVFTVSGLSQLDFTDDRAKLHETLLRLAPHPVVAGDPTGEGECPTVTYYQADLMVNQNDVQAKTLAIQDAIACMSLDVTVVPDAVRIATAAADAAALRSLAAGDGQTEYAIRRLQEIIRRLSALPGQRSMVLVSPGFLYPKHEWDISDTMDRATRVNVVINTLDARGLYIVDPAGDINKRKTFEYLAPIDPLKGVYAHVEQARQTDVLKELADGTGGLAFYNNNDLDAGFRTVGAVPAASYLLGFVPQNLKYDGRFHSLKVTVASKAKLSVQARHGFFAPRHGITAAELAQQDLEDALFSRDEQHGLPVALHTQYFLAGPAAAQLAVLTHVDIGHMHFEKVQGRNKNDLTVVAALFDRNGNFVTANQKVVEMRLRDVTLENLKSSGVTVKTSFDVKPGAYIVRLVVRDSNAALSAANGVVEIPDSGR
jgi:VWFA-related protein